VRFQRRPTVHCPPVDRRRPGRHAGVEFLAKRRSRPARLPLDGGTGTIPARGSCQTAGFHLPFLGQVGHDGDVQKRAALAIHGTRFAWGPRGTFSTSEPRPPESDTSPSNLSGVLVSFTVERRRLGLSGEKSPSCGAGFGWVSDRGTSAPKERKSSCRLPTGHP
jgi:hypothetical protein